VYHVITGSLLGCALLGASMAGQASSPEEFTSQYFSQKPVSSLARFSDANSAYAFQQQLTDRFVALGHSPIGYKLGLTGERRLFGAPEPLYARLFDFMALPNHSSVSTSGFVKPLLELELAYQFRTDLTPPFTPQRIAAAIQHIAPAVELADMVFANPKTLSWKQLAAYGVGARHIIIGTPVKLNVQTLDQYQAEARWNGELYTRGYSQNVMNGQITALSFLANQLNQRGQQLKAGEWVLTGAMNRMLPAKAGDYNISFGELGELSFTLQP